MAEETTTEETTEEAPNEETTEQGKGSKEAVLADLARERKNRQAAESRLAELEAEIQKHREDAMSEQEKALEKAKREAAEAAKAEVTAAATRRLFAAEVRIAAAGKVIDPDLFADAEVAQRLLGFDEIPTTDDGDIDTKAVEKAVSELLTKKPHLAARRGVGGAGGPQGTPVGSASDVNSWLRRQAGRA